MPHKYLVIDLEATCDDRGRIPRDETEIIEIGAVLVDGENLEPLSEFQRFVRPQRHPVLTPFCTQLTSITQADVEHAATFPEVIAELAEFVRGEDFLFCSWGNYDRNQLRHEATVHGIALPLGDDHWNVKQAFADRLGVKPSGLERALQRAGLTFDGTAHRGIDDARNIARLLPFALGRVQPDQNPRTKRGG